MVIKFGRADVEGTFLGQIPDLTIDDGMVVVDHDTLQTSNPCSLPAVIASTAARKSSMPRMTGKKPHTASISGSNLLGRGDMLT